MADEAQPNSLYPPRRSTSSRAGDVPEALRARYYTESRVGGMVFYADATVTRPAFRDHGGRLVAERSDPRVIQDLTLIAQHRGWTIVTARGARSFRRQAWLIGRLAGLEVRGYRPTERDTQALERRLGHRTASQPPQERPGRSKAQDAGQSTLKIVESVVRTRISSEQARERILAAARARISTWQERSAQQASTRGTEPNVFVARESGRERQR